MTQPESPVPPAALLPPVPRPEGLLHATGAPRVASPCIQVCQLDADQRICTGCWREIDEIVGWSRLGEDAKRAIWAQLPARRKAAMGEGPLGPIAAA